MFWSYVCHQLGRGGGVIQQLFWKYDEDDSRHLNSDKLTNILTLTPP